MIDVMPMPCRWAHGAPAAWPFHRHPLSGCAGYPIDRESACPASRPAPGTASSCRPHARRHRRPPERRSPRDGRGSEVAEATARARRAADAELGRRPSPATRRELGEVARAVRARSQITDPAAAGQRGGLRRHPGESMNAALPPVPDGGRARLPGIVTPSRRRHRQDHHQPPQGRNAFRRRRSRRCSGRSTTAATTQASADHPHRPGQEAFCSGGDQRGAGKGGTSAATASAAERLACSGRSARAQAVVGLVAGYAIGAAMCCT